jgi:hypothetical protein
MNLYQPTYARKNLFSLIIGIILFCLNYSVLPMTINGKFTVLDSTSSAFTVLLQINSISGSDDLGGATIVISFDTTAISFTNNPIKEVDYIFHNFNDGNYSPATITRPMKNKIWVNIDLPYINNNNGTIVAGSPEWTDVVTIHFDIVDPSRSSNLNWLTTSPFWGVYDGDNSTIWQTGEFQNYPTSVEPGSEDLPTSFELSQNYPNPFNPSTKIKFTIPSTGSEQSVPVQLKVYDILGNEVATLVDEQKEPVVYEVEFSTNNGLSALASGIYIYRIQSADPSSRSGQSFIDTKKMVLLK